MQKPFICQSIRTCLDFLRRAVFHDKRDWTALNNWDHGRVSSLREWQLSRAAPRGHKFPVLFPDVRSEFPAALGSQDGHRPLGPCREGVCFADGERQDQVQL